MNETRNEAEELTGLAGKLRGATDVLDTGIQPPPAPNAGEATKAVVDAMALLTGAAAESMTEDCPGTREAAAFPAPVDPDEARAHRNEPGEASYRAR
ncbi:MULTISPECIES: hypothetical protein [unclassified Actinopolyspora]|uniref:hypothetical protein n=1 Tax=Actinopolyspora TaxID=1849 RepID=UPI0013F5BF92|nr:MULTISPECIES: hypothetical protein [unclassified Actinopolyspora]NHD18989.1 hypothetical protein [Actinopolyspora sp. BKK2]NHE78226.1 hypothetical protein [Actinopolyspora sp. BKK1]